ncbi:MAG: hypothetical protein IJP43_05840 [Oscillospiraceae bacterium]|nr:hypothetical protein [Oscillospiraceae bacterium]
MTGVFMETIQDDGKLRLPDYFLEENVRGKVICWQDLYNDDVLCFTFKGQDELESLIDELIEGDIFELEINDGFLILNEFALALIKEKDVAIVGCFSYAEIYGAKRWNEIASFEN